MIALFASLLAVVTTPYAPVSYACDGSTASFTINFPYQSSSNLAVTSTTAGGVSTTLILGNDFTTSVVSTQSTATLTILSPSTRCPSGNTLKIARTTTLTQPTSFRQQTRFSPDTVETVADRLEMQTQEAVASIVNPVLPQTLTNATPLVARGGTASIQLQDWLSMTLNGKSYGMLCNGSTDDTAALQAAVNDAISTGSPLFIPAGNCKLSATINIQNVVALRFFGAGGGSSATKGTSFAWAGNNTTPMFLLDDVRDSVFESFSIVTSSTAPLAVGIQSVNGAGVSVSPTNNRFHNLFFNGSNSTGLDKGFKFSTGSGGDANNADMVFDHVVVANYTTAAWSFESTQSFGHYFYSCRFESNGVGATGIVGSGFSWYGGGGGGNTITDFELASPQTGYVTISGGDFEGSSRFIHTGGPSGAYSPTSVIGNRWTSNGINADNRAIFFQVAGPLTLIGNIIGSNVAIPMEIWLNIGASGQAVAFGNQIRSNLADPFTGNPTLITQFGNVKNDSASVLVGQFTATTFANLGTPVAGSITYCSDCTIASPCAGAGTGAIAKRLNGVWVCN